MVSPAGTKDKRRKKDRSSPGAIDIVEEAVHLLRLSPVGTLVTYYVGSLPFILGLLYFWSDMSRSAYAYKIAGAASFGMAGLFVWMKFWQAIFAARLTAQIRRQHPPVYSMNLLLRMAATQALLQATGLFLMPLALIMVFPFGWLYAFYQNVTIVTGEENHNFKPVIHESWVQARLWPITNHQLLLILFAFGFFVWLNLMVSLLALPHILKTLLGLDTMFTRGGMAAFNTTFLAGAFGLAYLCLDPLIKAIYVIRCHYGRAIKTGLDLKVELAAGKRTYRTLTMALVFLLTGAGLFLTSLHATAQAAASSSPVETAVSPEELGRSITEVLEKREYTWRMPRERPPESQEEEPGLLEGFLDWLDNKIKAMFKAIGRFFKNLIDWMSDLFPKGKTTPQKRSSGLDWMASTYFLLFLVLAVCCSVLAVVFYRGWRMRRRERPAVLSATVEKTIPDLNDESITADERPGNEWLTMARKLTAEGSYRLALRALYLATLARLAEHELISIAKYKSNRDYLRELSRRFSKTSDVPEMFADNVNVFDRVWYGEYNVTYREVQQFDANQEKIIASVERTFHVPPKLHQSPLGAS